ncbi:MAG TPA: acetylglutamate kinase [Myxococcales bacterium]|nr:acetylglutamate kinase [Deltaproteobacteria bacterium]HAA59002.1 acetylglutamate kinase [Myxococcales bacterium]
MNDSLDLLREALPYIQHFDGKVFIIKLSGKVTENKEYLKSLMEEVALFQQVGFYVVLVHGGGKQLTEMANKLDVPQTIVDGRRVTDGKTLELAKMVFAGQIRTDILSTLRQMGAKAVGISGIDGNVLHAERREAQAITNRETGEKEMVDFGHVGDIVKVDTDLLRLLLNGGYIPVVSSLAADDQGNVFNVNADTIAAEIAVHLKAEKLLLLSNVDGIYRDFSDPSTKINRLTLEEAKTLYNSSEISEGMLPKLKSIIHLVERGVKSAHIINGLRRNVLFKEIFTKAGTGTMIFQDGMTM